MEGRLSGVGRLLRIRLTARSVGDWQPDNVARNWVKAFHRSYACPNRIWRPEPVKWPYRYVRVFL